MGEARDYVGEFQKLAEEWMNKYGPWEGSARHDATDPEKQKLAQALYDATLLMAFPHGLLICKRCNGKFPKSYERDRRTVCEACRTPQEKLARRERAENFFKDMKTFLDEETGVNKN